MTTHQNLSGGFAFSIGGFGGVCEVGEFRHGPQRRAGQAHGEGDDEGAGRPPHGDGEPVVVEGDTGEPQAQGCEDHTGHPGCGEDFPHMGFVADGERVRGDGLVHCGQCNPGDEDDDGADPKVVDGDQ